MSSPSLTSAGSNYASTTSSLSSSVPGISDSEYQKLADAVHQQMIENAKKAAGWVPPTGGSSSSSSSSSWYTPYKYSPPPPSWSSSGSSAGSSSGWSLSFDDDSGDGVNPGVYALIGLGIPLLIILLCVCCACAKRRSAARNAASSGALTLQPMQPVMYTVDIEVGPAAIRPVAALPGISSSSVAEGKPAGGVSGVVMGRPVDVPVLAEQPSIIQESKSEENDMSSSSDSGAGVHDQQQDQQQQ